MGRNRDVIGPRVVNFVLSGLGGQGILFMTKVFAEAGLRKGFNILGAETHGMAQRGGSVVSHLRFGEVQSSLVRAGSAHYLLAAEENEAYRNLPFLAPTGKLYVNSLEREFPKKEVQAYLRKKNILCRSVGAGELALRLGAPMAANLALVGFFAAFEKAPLDVHDLRDTLSEISPDRFRSTNLKVFDAGLEKGEEIQARE